MSAYEDLVKRLAAALVSWSTETIQEHTTAGLSSHEANGVMIDVASTFLASVLANANVSSASAAILHERLAEMYRTGRGPEPEEVTW
jgi:hypothetical protein